MIQLNSTSIASRLTQTLSKLKHLHPRVGLKTCVVGYASSKLIRLSRYSKGTQDPPQGFKPKNTLNRPTHILSVSPNSRFKSQDHPNGRKRPVLDTETSTGDNVPSVLQHSKFSRDLNDRSRSKRPKLGSHFSSDNSSDVVEALWDPLQFDPRQPDRYIVTRHQQSKGRSQGRGSQGPSNYSQAPGTGRCSVNADVKEYGSVERTMQNGERTTSKRRQHKIGNHLRSDYSSTAIKVTTSSPSLDTDPLQNTLQHKQEIDKRRLNYESSSLQKLFIDSHGERRGKIRSPDRLSISSDELASATTVGDNVRRQSPPKYSRPNSPLKSSPSQNPISSSSNATGLEPSNIPPGDFTSSRSGRLAQKIPTQQTTYPGENKALWAIDLSCVNVAGDTGEAVRGPSLGLVFDDTSKAYIIRKKGKSLTATNPSLQIQPKRLLAVKWAPDSPKVRFTSSRIGNHDNTLDIEMQSNKGVFELLKELNKHNAKYVVNNKDRYVMSVLDPYHWGNRTYTIDRDYMDKIFETRQSQHESYPRKADSSSTQVPEDIQLAARNKERRDMAQKDLFELGNCERRRERTEADQDGDKPRLSRGMRLCPREPKSGSIFDPHPEEEQADTNDLRKIDKILGVVHRNHTPNPHLRGSRINLELEPRNSSIQPPIDQFSRPLKYSVTEGLGKSWSKPLLYPKTGKKKISVEWMDLERLDEGEFLNDNLIAFYLRFLQDQLEERSPELAKRVYFFNTFFFASLTNTQRGKKGINYEAVQKWTRSVDIFSYDYVVVPINESAHWYVAIICNLPALASNPDVGEDTSKDEPPLSPDDHDDPDGVLTRSLGRENSPAANVSAEENCLRLQKTEDHPIEQDPSASFAELTLETDPERCSELGKEVLTVQNATDNSTLYGVGQALLDTQLEGNIAESAMLERREVFSGGADLKAVKNDVTIAQSHSPKASPVSRKRKRKSIPPTQRTDPTSPLILTFDSLGLAHPPTIRTLKDYLLAEGRAKREMELDVSRIKGMTAKQIPQQDNMCDCGLFLLGYIDKFLDGPKDFITRVIGHKYDLEKDWSKLVPSDLRAGIRTQIQALYAEQESERQDEKRESAKRANKYHERSLQHSDTGPSSNITQLKSNPSEAREALEQGLIAVARNLSPERPSTREMALKTAIPIGETLAGEASDVLLKQSKRSRSNHFHQDSSDPLHQDVDTTVHRSSSALLQQDPSLIVIESQSDPNVSKLNANSKPYSAPNPRDRSVSVELPSTIEDSQPSLFQDLLEEGNPYSRKSPSQSSVKTDDQRSASRGGRSKLWGDEHDDSPKEESRTKQTASASVKIEHQPRSSRRHKPTPVIELD